MSSPVREIPTSASPSSPPLSPPLRNAVNLLEQAARDGDADAIYLLARMNFFGDYDHPRNYSGAFGRYHDLATLDGNASAQHMMGFMYGTGIGHVVERDPARSLLYYTSAALAGHAPSELAVAFRHHAGIGTPRNCEEAVVRYRQVAEKAIDFWRSGPPGGRSMFRLGHHLADDEGGAYGEGASASSSGIYAAQGGAGSDAYAAFEDVLEYLELMSRKGDLTATFRLGRVYYEGPKATYRNARKAKNYFTLVAKKYWSRDGRVIAGTGPTEERMASRAAGYLGRIYLRGEGVDQSFEKALTWFRRGTANGNPMAQHGMGLLYLNGYGVPKDVIKAADYFKASAEADYGPAQVDLGTLFLDQGDVASATHYFEHAIRHGHIEAFYYLAEIDNGGIGRDRSCGMAAAEYKIVAERAEEVHSPLAEANQAYEDGDLETALVLYMMAAEQGYEVAQANVAYLLDEQKSRLPLPSLLPGRRLLPPPPASRLRDPRLALIYWTRSAKQSNVDSMVKMGDYYLAGLGTDADHEKAATCYQSAAEFQQSAQALWDLGWMHENGLGVEQDYHLAKRYYDLALETNQESYLPVLLSLLKLRARSFWNTLTNGRVNSIQSEPGQSSRRRIKGSCGDIPITDEMIQNVAPKREWSFYEWIDHFRQHDHIDDPEIEEDDDLTDPIPEHLPATDDVYGDLIDDGIIEGLVIVSLAAVLAFLVYFRQQRQLNRQRPTQDGQADNPPPPPPPPPDQQPQAPPVAAVAPPEPGLFPPPGHLDFAQWVAGGVAH